MAVEVCRIELMADNISRLALDVSDCSYAKVDQKWNGKQVCAPFNRIYVLEKGEGILVTETETVVMRPGMAYLVPAGILLDFYCPASMEKYFFHLNLYKPDRYDLFFGMKQIGVLPYRAEQRERLKRNLYGGGYVNLLAVKQELYGLLMEFAAAYLPAGMDVPVYSEPIVDTIRYIRRNLSAKLQLEELSDRLFVSRNYLSQQFRCEVGVTMWQYITDQLMMEAQKRLSQTDESIGEISHRLGYDDQCYFSRRFKQLCGVSPVQYRKMMKP